MNYDESLQRIATALERIADSFSEKGQPEEVEIFLNAEGEVYFGDEGCIGEIELDYRAKERVWEYLTGADMRQYLSEIVGINIFASPGSTSVVRINRVKEVMKFLANAPHLQGEDRAAIQRLLVKTQEIVAIHCRKVS